jgi:hypothetical protein
MEVANALLHERVQRQRMYGLVVSGDGESWMARD